MSDCPCPLALACAELLRPSLAERMRRLRELSPAEAMAVRAEERELAALLHPLAVELPHC